MSFHTPQKIAEITVDAGESKAKLPMATLLVLGFLAGAFIAFGFLLDIRVSGDVPPQWGSFASFLGAAVFPLGLILCVLAGAELLTGAMMSLPLAAFAGRISFGRVMTRWIVILVMNFIGSVFVAYFFGHVVGLTETGPYLTKTVAVANAKLADHFGPAFVSAIGCNWLVCLGVWLAYGAQDFAGKILGLWFPIMGFVAIGFQHVVANMFVIPAAIFAGQATWGQYFGNFVPVVLGNLVGGVLFVAVAYYLAYLRKPSQAA
ncbi:formate/nitrite transporter family protein [Alicyclobacillus fastidiosus]|uniref:Formate/nitrite transporter family protein n=1 Tax=Alicyclobacillus fastidiosus TaxID=392011 RepID=A0ABV5AD22_9BACL|nr:formate/nitrite transporter family protein [Alicyclobacillus fastidiosus]WEH08837.1 formate/nitrite transporter family protein [Alicyclobacillus fastidiosus]